MRDGHLCQQQGRVRGLGAVRLQYRGQDRASGHVDGDTELRPPQTPVLQDGHDVQSGGVDLHLLTGPHHHRCQRSPHRRRSGPRSTPGPIGRISQHAHQPVER